MYDIEDGLTGLTVLEKRLDWLKRLKESRVKTITEEIKVYEAKIDWTRDLILKTMQKHAPDDKTVSFPGVGKVTRRHVKGSWNIDDETIFLAYLEKEGLKEQVIETKEVLDKKKAKELLTSMARTGTDVPGVSKKDDADSLSISIDPNETGRAKQVEMSMDELDSI